VDNSRAVEITVALANYLGVDIDQLPVVASAPEPTSEKAVSIGTYAVAAGLPTHVGVVPPVTGSALCTTVLTQTVKELTGGYFIVEPDPEKAADALLQAINDRRLGLGLE
jgi:carbon-monoxide dehydrogenase catalytic subunit